MNTQNVNHDKLHKETVESSILQQQNSTLLNIHKISGKGEDADPLMIIKDTICALFVFDGLGGAGSQKVNRGEQVYTLAYLASRKTREITSNYFKTVLDESNSIETLDIDNYRDTLFNGLKSYAESLNIPESKIKTKLIKKLPTTMAGLIIYQSDKTFDILSLSAGDSRNYILSPGLGLQQLSIDDISENLDALDNLSGDSLMTNFVNADELFHINSRSYKTIETPLLFFSSSDGAFDYLQTPMHFEYIVLKSISDSNTFSDFEKQLDNNLLEVKGDDISMALIFKGWEDFQQMKMAFAKRLAFLKTTYIDTLKLNHVELERKKTQLEQLATEVNTLKSNTSEFKAKLWQNYKENYNRLIQTTE